MTPRTAVRPSPTQQVRGGSRPGLLLPLATAAALVLASAPLSVLFTGAWLPVVVLTVAAVCGTGGVLRALRVPLVAVPLAQTAVFLCLLTWFLIRDTDPGSLVAFRDLVAGGVVAVRDSVAPVAAGPQTLALLAVLVFLCALLVETLTVGLGLAGFSGLLLLVMAAVPFGIRPAGSLLLLAAPALGWVMLLAADQVVRMEPVRHWGDGAARRGLPAALGLAVVAVACAAAVLATLVPTTQTPWLRNWWNDIGPGTVSGAALDPLVSVRTQLTGRPLEEVLRYTSSDGKPAYLRLVTLEEFDGAAWAADPPTPSVPLWRPTSADDPSLEIAVGSLANRYLPVPDGAVSVELPGASEWGWDTRTGDAVSSGPVASGLRYRVTTDGESPDPQVLASATSDSPRVSATARAVPVRLPGEVADLAAEVTGGAGSNFERAVALQEWFTGGGGFRYSLVVPDPAGRDPLLAFLTDRVGFCQQYATAMAAMARTLGIPARVVVGFTGGTQGEDGVYTVTGADAHVWPELWFDGVGWVRFEPTPAASAAVAAPEVIAPGQSPAPTSAPTARAEDQQPSQPTAPGPQSAADGGSVWTWWWLLAFAGLVPATLVVLGVLRRRRRIRRLAQVQSAGDLEAGWREIRDSALDAGIGWPWGRTMRQQADTVSAALPEAGAGDAFRRLVAGAERNRYAPGDSPQRSAPSLVIVDEPSTVTDDALEDVTIVLSALDRVARRPWWRIVPRSLLRRPR